MGRDNDRGSRRFGSGRDRRRDNDSYGDSDGGFRSNFGGRSSFSGPREMHKATCSDCQQECEVPFKPTEGRPVFCKNCFSKHKPPRSF